MFSNIRSDAGQETQSRQITASSHGVFGGLRRAAMIGLTSSAMTVALASPAFAASDGSGGGAVQASPPPGATVATPVEMSPGRLGRPDPAPCAWSTGDASPIGTASAPVVPPSAGCPAGTSGTLEQTPAITTDEGIAQPDSTLDGPAEQPTDDPDSADDLNGADDPSSISDPDGSYDEEYGTDTDTDSDSGDDDVIEQPGPRSGCARRLPPATARPARPRHTSSPCFTPKNKITRARIIHRTIKLRGNCATGRVRVSGRGVTVLRVRRSGNARCVLTLRVSPRSHGSRRLLVKHGARMVVRPGVIRLG